MDWGLNASILQIVASVSFLVVALRYGRNIVRTHHIVSGALGLVLTLSVLASCASVAERLGWFSILKTKTVSDCHFSKEAVVLDDHEFRNCVFEDVTFRYGGGQVFLAPDNKYVGRSTFEITDGAANNIIRMMIGLGIIGNRPKASISWRRPIKFVGGSEPARACHSCIFSASQSAAKSMPTWRLSTWACSAPPSRA